MIVHDNAPWHGVKRLPQLLLEKGVHNILILRLPKYSPEMNPCERLWKWMREDVTHCRYYESLGDLSESVWKFYRKAYHQKEKAILRFKPEKPLFDISLKACRRGFILFYCLAQAIKT